MDLAFVFQYIYETHFMTTQETVHQEEGGHFTVVKVFTSI